MTSDFLQTANKAIKFVPAKKTASTGLPTRYFGIRLWRRYIYTGGRTKALYLLVLFVLSNTVVAESLQSIEALNGKLFIEVPKNFNRMSIELVELKYPSSRRPSDVLSDETGGITLAFNHTQTPILPSQIREAHGAISKMFHNLYPSAKWYRDEVIRQNGNDFLVMELITPAIDAQIHNIFYGTSVDDRLLLVAFNATVEQAPKWLPIGQEIMRSIEVK